MHMYLVTVWVKKFNQLNVFISPILSITVILLTGLLVPGCSMHVQQQSQYICQQCQLHYLNIPNAPSPLISYSRNVPPNSNNIHVYLEGDGTPFLRPNIPASNPSRSSLLALQLMQLDPSPSIYLNRPCYGHNKLPPTCTPIDWTSHRYSATTVHHMNIALDILKNKLNVANTKVMLIGHSGGGGLALLMAQHRSDIQDVVTLAGNLDTDAWTDWHHYTPLYGSLNPAKMPQLTGSIMRWHYVGEDDRVMPPSLLKAASERDVNARFVVVKGVGHVKGWVEWWPTFLGNL